MHSSCLYFFWTDIGQSKRNHLKRASGLRMVKHLRTLRSLGKEDEKSKASMGHIVSPPSKKKKKRKKIEKEGRWAQMGSQPLGEMSSKKFQIKFASVQAFKGSWNGGNSRERAALWTWSPRCVPGMAFIVLIIQSYLTSRNSTLVWSLLSHVDV